MSLPASYPLDLYRGDTFPFAARLWTDEPGGVPSDLTGVVPRAQLRSETGALLLEIECTLELPNIVHMTIPAETWPPHPPDRARWDLELTYPSGAVRTVVAGPVRVTGDVTVPS